MFRRALVVSAAMIVIAAAIAIPFAFHSARTVSAAPVAPPAYTSSGEMLPPANYREWIFLTSGLDMSYSPKPPDVPYPSQFDNVFVNPEAYRSFLESGTWPDKTLIVLEAREARSKSSINERGHFQSGAAKGFEVHVKDEARFPGKWAFFSFDSPSSNGTLIPQGAPCYTCHTAHAAVDTTFVQFYPTLLPIATNKGTLSKLYLQEEATHNAGK